MPYAKLEAKVFASGDMPSKMDIRSPSSSLLYMQDRKYGAPAPNVASKIPKKTRVTIRWVMFFAAPEHMAAAPHLCKSLSALVVLLGNRLRVLPNAENGNVDVGRKDLPEHCSPLKENVSDIEGVEHPSPLRRAQAKIILGASSFGIANVAAVKIRQDI